MASPGKQVQFQEPPGDEHPLVVFNKGAVDGPRKRKMSRAASRLSMGSIRLQSEEEGESQDREESVVSLKKS